MTRRHAARSWRRAAHGVALPIALIMLLALALLGVWAFNGSTTGLRVVGNAQSRQEAFSAVQTALEATISSQQFIENPQAVAASPILVDVDGSGRTRYTARLAPQPVCYRVRAVSVGELNPALATDLPCLISQRPTGIESAVAGPPAGASLCADMEWNVRAEVGDPATGTYVASNQGIAVRGLVTDAATNCP